MSEKKHPGTTALTIIGILMMVFGVIAIATPAVAGTAVVYVVGSVMLIAGIVQLVSGLRAEAWSNKLLPIILGAITTVAAIGVLGHPWLGLKVLTLVIMAFFIVEGIWKVIASFSYRPAKGWIALLLSGILTFGLGALIWMQWPEPAYWVVGVLVGVDFLMTGISLVLVASTLRALRDAVEEGKDKLAERLDADASPESNENADEAT